MKRFWAGARDGAFAGGAAGILVGFFEAAYRNAELWYGPLLYATLWVLVGAGLGGLFAALRPKLPIGRVLFALALGASMLVLVRFILWRDVYQQAPGSGLKASLIALVVASMVGGGAWATVRPLKNAQLSPNIKWGAVVVLLLVFASITLRGDDQFPGPTGSDALPGEGVILMVVDTLRADALGVYGASDHRGQPASPNIDRLARSGRLFVDTTAQASWTKPAVASLMTSRHVSGHQTMSKKAVLPESLPTLADTLKEAGVQTGAVVTNYNLEEGFGFSQGFDYFHYLPPARYLGAPPRANRLAAYNVYRLLREKLLARWRTSDAFYRSAEVVNRVGESLLETMGQGKFFLWLHYMEPHDPYFPTTGRSYAKVERAHPPQEWTEPMYTAYRDEIQRLDRAIGSFLETLERRGLSERVSVVLTADHGEEFGDHGGFWHGVTLYQEQVHIPLMVRTPNAEAATDANLARQIDVAPTIASLLGVAPPPTWEGRNLLGDTAPPASVLAEEDHEGNVLSMVREKALKLIRANPDNPRGLPAEEAFDLSHDPKEQSPLKLDAAKARLEVALEEAKGRAHQNAAEETERALDTEAEAELRALGYME